MIKKIWTLFVFTCVLFGSTIDYIKKGANIVDIGKKHGNNEIVVPFEIIQYEPTLTQVANVILYERRKEERAACIIDGLNHESCPIDKKECDVDKEYAQGTSSKEEHYMSCSALNPASYFDPLGKKCVLPSNEAKVCTKYPDSHYDSTRDKCITGTTYPAQETLARVDFLSYSTFLYELSSLLKSAGATYVNGIFENLSVNGYPFGVFEITHNSAKKITISSSYYHYSFDILPGQTVHVIFNARLDNPEAHGLPPFSFVVGSNLYPAVPSYSSKVSYSCSSGDTMIELNGEKWCSSEALYEPSCSHNPAFPQRDKDVCLGDKKTYTFYNYDCPTDSNAYGNTWEIVDPGGDCGENNLATDTDGDGINDQCNSPVPNPQNCERINYKCSFNPDAVCVLDEINEDYNDFTKWTVYNWDNQDSYTIGDKTYLSSNWEVLNQNSVIQHVNGLPTYFLSNYEMRDGLIIMEGTFKTDDAWDNDWFGFVFGMKDETHYYLLDWSRWKNDNYNKLVDGEYVNRDADGNPINGAIPLTLAKVSGLTSRGPLWSHLDSGASYKVLQRKDNGGWTSGQEYKIRIEISRNDIKVWTGKVGEEMNLDIDYHSDIALDISGKLGFYNYSISKVTYKDFRIEWNDGGDLSKTTKRPLGNPGEWSGGFKENEYGVLRDGACPNSGGQCKGALSSVTGDGSKLCFADKNRENSCIELRGLCSFSGRIVDTAIFPAPVFSFLNSPSEPVPGYDGRYLADASSPTGVSLDFANISDSFYDAGQIKTSAEIGDKLTVDFWMYWRGDSGAPIGFTDYNLLLSVDNALGSNGIGFNSGINDLFGSTSIDNLSDGWHKITAIFTQGDMGQNKLYIDGASVNMENLSDSDGTGAMSCSDLVDPSWYSKRIAPYFVNSGYKEMVSHEGYSMQCRINEIDMGGDCRLDNNRDGVPDSGLSSCPDEARYSISGGECAAPYVKVYDTLVLTRDAEYAAMLSEKLGLKNHVNGDIDISYYDTGWIGIKSSDIYNGNIIALGGVGISKEDVYNSSYYDSEKMIGAVDYFNPFSRCRAGEVEENGKCYIGNTQTGVIREGMTSCPINYGNRYTLVDSKCVAPIATHYRILAVSDNPETSQSLASSMGLIDGVGGDLIVRVYPYYYAGISALDALSSSYSVLGGFGIKGDDIISRHKRIDGRVIASSGKLAISEKECSLFARCTGMYVTTKYLTNNEKRVCTLSSNPSDEVDLPAQPHLDITKPLVLSSKLLGDNYSFDGKIAGINIWEGELTPEQINLLYRGGFSDGIVRLDIQRNSIKGYAFDDTFLGEINSTCELSGKVGFFGRMKNLPTDATLPKEYYSFGMTLPYKTSTAPSCEQNDTIITFDVKDKYDVLSATLTETKFNDWIAVWVNGNLVNVGPYGGDRLAQLWSPVGSSVTYESLAACQFSNADAECIAIPSVRYGIGKEGACELGKDWVQSHNIDILPYLRDGTNTVKIRTVGDGKVGTGITFKFYTSQYNMKCASGCSYYNENAAVGIPPQDMVNVLVGSPITAAKVLNNRIEFWNSYESKGESGFIEIMKGVAPQDAAAGYKYEFEELSKLYDMGFTGFKSDGSSTYATSSEKMDISSCQNAINGTHYFLAERNASDLSGLKLIESLSHYFDGSFGDYCIIQKRGVFDNHVAEYSVKTEVIPNTHFSYFCSPWTCEAHQCGTASCLDDFKGNILKTADMDFVKQSPICIDQVCDLNLDYFSVCGNMTGCTDDPLVYRQENGSCMKVGCDDGGVFNTETGKCEKYGCKNSIERDGKCYKSF